MAGSSCGIKGRASAKGQTRIYPLRHLLWYLPCFAGFMFFSVAPLIGSGYYALTLSAFRHEFVGLLHVADLFRSEQFMVAYRNSLLFSLALTPCLIALSLFLAIAFSESEITWRRVGFLFVLPALLPSVAIVPIWRILFGWEGGTASGSVQWLSAFAMAIFRYTGINVLILFSGIESIDPSIQEAAALDGAGQVRRHMTITLPLIVPYLYVALVYSLLCSNSLYAEVSLLYGNYPAHSVYFMSHYIHNSFGNLNYSVLSAAAYIFSLTLLALFGAVYRWIYKKGWLTA